MLALVQKWVRWTSPKAHTSRLWPRVDTEILALGPELFVVV
jgi:hypothetical protein